jgi:uncharacterized cofD-like protein
MEQGYHLVAIGGGGGTSHILTAAESFCSRRTAIVAVTDTGRSTGVARSLANMPAPGDLRNTLATMAADPTSLFANLLQHRFHSHEVTALEGMAFGNLLIAALTQMTGDFARAIATVAELVESSVQVLPVSTVSTHLCAELEDGCIMEDEFAVRGLNKSPIRRVFLADTPAPAHQPALDAITEADMVVIGPGSLFTSILVTLLFDGVIDALRRTKATVVYVCNTSTQPGQTDGYRAIDHINRVTEVLGEGVLDVAVLNRSPNLDPAVVLQYANDGVYLLTPDEEEMAMLDSLGVRCLVEDHVVQVAAKQQLWNKQDSIRRDPALLGRALWNVLHHGTHGHESAE